MIGSQAWTLPLAGWVRSPIIGKSMSCMHFSLTQPPLDDSTESSDSITYWCKPLDADRRDDGAEAPVGGPVKQRRNVRTHPRIAQLSRHAVQDFGGIGEDHHHHLIIRHLDDPEALESLEGSHLVGQLVLGSHEHGQVD